MSAALYALGAYLLGSIPFAIVVSRAMGLADPRTYGSGNIGATNVLRTGNRRAALFTLIGDAAKGWLAVIIAHVLAAPMEIIALVAFCAFLGHVFPVWLRFRGGKGVATALGVLIPLAWPVAVIAALLWLATALLSHYSSLAALVAAVASAGIAPLIVDRTTALVIAAIALLIIFRHHSNIRRLMAGTESRISFRKS